MIGWRARFNRTTIGLQPPDNLLERFNFRRREFGEVPRVVADRVRAGLEAAPVVGRDHHAVVPVPDLLPQRPKAQRAKAPLCAYTHARPAISSPVFAGGRLSERASGRRMDHRSTERL